MIRKNENGSFTVTNEAGTREFGTYQSEQEAQKRLQQIEYFKHAGSHKPKRGK